MNASILDSRHATEPVESATGAGAEPFLIFLYHSVFETGAQSRTQGSLRRRVVYAPSRDGAALSN